MFTGIIESLGKVIDLQQEGGNVNLTIQSSISSDLHIDQSLAHDGVCLTVVKLSGDVHTVTAVEETLSRSNLAQLEAGSLINLERAMRPDGRLDGHIVQGHVDTIAEVTHIEDRDGSWNVHFRYEPTEDRLLVDKGSICVNGVSLTVVQPSEDRFSVAIIPYTWEHTNFHTLQSGHKVNLEFDILGKYIARYAKLYSNRGT